MASINFRFALLVAFLVIFIGHGLVSDAKPIEKKEGGEEKDAPEEVAANTEGDEDDDDDSDDSTKDVVNAGIVETYLLPTLTKNQKIPLIAMTSRMMRKVETLHRVVEWVAGW